MKKFATMMISALLAVSVKGQVYQVEKLFGNMSKSEKGFIEKKFQKGLMTISLHNRGNVVTQAVISTQGAKLMTFPIVSVLEKSKRKFVGVIKFGLGLDAFAEPKLAIAFTDQAYEELKDAYMNDRTYVFILRGK